MMVTSSAPKVLDARPELAGTPPAGSAARPRPGQGQGQGQPKQARKLTRPAVALMAVVMFQLLFVSVYLGVLHHPALHHAPVAVVGTSPVAGAASRHGGGAIRLVPEPSARAAGAAIRDGQAYAALVPGRHGETLLIQTAASPGTASILTKGFTAAAAAVKVPLVVHDLAPLPASDPAGSSAYFLIVGWVLGGYVGATTLGMISGGMRSSSLRQAAARLGLLGGYAAVSGFASALLFGPALGIMSGFSIALAGVGLLVVFAAAAVTAALQAALGLPGTLIAIIGMVVFGNPTAGQSIATPLLASPWNVIGVLLPSGAGLSSARSVIYLGGVNLTGPLSVLLGYGAGGALVVLALAAWRQHRLAASASASATASVSVSGAAARGQAA
jgi:hypothetical protein